MKSCSECGFANNLDAPRCARCGFRFAVPRASKAPPGIPFWLLLPVVLLGSAVALAVQLVGDRKQLHDFRSKLDSQLGAARAEHETEWLRRVEEDNSRVRAQESAHAARLQDKLLISGELARRNRDTEWAKRLARDPEFALSPLERTMVRMQKVGADPALATREALEEVARLAAPPGSRIEVTNAFNNLALRVAFKMSAVVPSAAGVAMKHKSNASMRREAQEGSAYIMKELFDACGARGIARLSLSCNYAVYAHSFIPQAATEAERKELEKRGAVIMACLYRVSIDASKAAAVPNWRTISIPRVIELMRVDYDGISSLTVSALPLNVPRDIDPDMQLEF